MEGNKRNPAWSSLKSAFSEMAQTIREQGAAEIHGLDLDPLHVQIQRVTEGPGMVRASAIGLLKYDVNNLRIVLDDLTHDESTEIPLERDGDAVVFPDRKPQEVSAAAYAGMILAKVAPDLASK